MHTDQDIHPRHLNRTEKVHMKEYHSFISCRNRSLQWPFPSHLPHNFSSLNLFDTALMSSLDTAEVISGNNGPCRVLSFRGNLRLSLRKFSFGKSGEFFFLLCFPALSFPKNYFFRAIVVNSPKLQSLQTQTKQRWLSNEMLNIIYGQAVEWKELCWKIKFAKDDGYLMTFNLLLQSSQHFHLLHLIPLEFQVPAPSKHTLSIIILKPPFHHFSVKSVCIIRCRYSLIITYFNRSTSFSHSAV